MLVKFEFQVKLTNLYYLYLKKGLFILLQDKQDG